MTDAEIIKALGACLHRGCNVCIRRPEEYGATERQCSRGLMKDTLSLINRQKAEIEKLELLNASLLESCEGYSKACDVYKAEIERLKGFVTPTVQLVNEYDIMIAKTEAIKEFAERLKGKGCYVTAWSTKNIDCLIDDKDVDNLVKEMVGDD